MGKAAEKRGEGIHIGLAEHRAQYFKEMNNVLLVSATHPSGKLNLGEMSLQGKGIYIGPLEQKQAYLRACSDRLESYYLLLTCTDRRCGNHNLGEMSIRSRTEGRRKMRAESRSDGGGEGEEDEEKSPRGGLSLSIRGGDAETTENGAKEIRIDLDIGTSEQVKLRRVSNKRKTKVTLRHLLQTFSYERCGKLDLRARSSQSRRGGWRARRQLARWRGRGAGGGAR
jgi:hypothetical protein